MKKKIKFLLFLSISLFIANSSNAQLNQGLLAHYCFDGNATDAAGTKHGTLMNGAIGTLDRGGNPNGAVKLDGIDDFIQLPSDPWITGDFSFSGWINIKSIGSWPHLWGFGNGTNAQNIFLSLGQGTNNTPHFTTHGCTNGGMLDRIAVTSASPLNTWFHIVVTMSGNSVSIYKDNALWVNGTSSILPCAAVKDSSFIGKSNFTFNNNALVDADIDDFRFYNRVLSAQEITQLNELEASNNCGPSWPNSSSTIDNTFKNHAIHPNPSTGRFSIKIPEHTQIEDLRIYDQIGKSIQFERFGKDVTISSTLAKGIYPVNIVLSNGASFTSKLMIQ